jgi:hypothetical protein
MYLCRPTCDVYPKSVTVWPSICIYESQTNVCQTWLSINVAVKTAKCGCIGWQSIQPSNILDCQMGTYRLQSSPNSVVVCVVDRLAGWATTAFWCKFNRANWKKPYSIVLYCLVADVLFGCIISDKVTYGLLVQTTTSTIQRCYWSLESMWFLFLLLDSFTDDTVGNIALRQWQPFTYVLRPRRPIALGLTRSQPMMTSIQLKYEHACCSCNERVVCKIRKVRHSHVLHQQFY